MARPRMHTVGETLGDRILAWIVDAVLLAVVVVPLLLVLDIGFTGPLPNLVNGAVGLGYFLVLEGYAGQTVGKRLLGIVVVDHQDGDDVTYLQSAFRNVVRVVDFLPAFYLVGVVTIALTDEGQRLGDLAGGTVVAKTG